MAKKHNLERKLDKNIHRVVVLGHSGFIGNHLEKTFRNSSSKVEFVGRSYPSIDLTSKEDTFSLADLFDMKTAVIMCSAIKRQLGDSLDIFLKNLMMVSNLCYLLEQHPVKRLIYFSSAAVYGEEIHNTKITEDTPVCPISYYGIAKYTSECLLRKVISQQDNSSLLAIRPPLVYGPGDQAKIYGPSGFSTSAINKEKITLWGDGDELREFMYVQDLAKIVHNLTFHDFNGVANISSGKSYSFREILGIISNLVPYELKIDSRPRTRKKVDNKFLNKRLLNLIPDVTFTNLEDGIKNIIDDAFQSDDNMKRGS